MLRSNKTVDDTLRIGRSKRFLKRLLSHNSIEEDDIEKVLLFETENIVQVENCLKNVLKTKQYRKRKEIYQVDIDTVKYVLETCDKMICKVKKNKQCDKKYIVKNKGNLYMVFNKINE